MSTDNRESWVLIKPDSYIAIPVSKFMAMCNDVKNIKTEWGSKGSVHHVSCTPMDMMLLTADQMTTMLVRDRLTQASEPDPSESA